VDPGLLDRRVDSRHDELRIAEILPEELRETIAKATTQAVIDDCTRAIAAIGEAKKVAATPIQRSKSDAERGILGT
jgi:hypothetical protein